MSEKIQLDNLLSTLRDRNTLLSLKRNDIITKYQFIYDNCVGNMDFLKYVYESLVNHLNVHSKSVEERVQLAIIFQYARRHFVDCDLIDPFIHFGVPDIDRESKSVLGKMKFKIDPS